MIMIYKPCFKFEQLTNIPVILKIFFKLYFPILGKPFNFEQL